MSEIDDAFAALDRMRGAPEVPRGDVTLPNRNLIEPGGRNDDEALLRELGLDDEGTPLSRPAPTRGRAAASEPPAPAVEGASLTDGKGFFMGHEITLSAGEREDLRSLLAQAVLRQLADEQNRIKEHAKKGRK